MAFESLTDERIEQLLKLQKRITNPTARTVVDANHDKRDYVVESTDGTERFRLFVRQNKTVSDDFSCGLQWLPAGSESLILARYNGSSHDHPNRLEGTYVDFVCHIHQATERYLQARLKPEGFAQATDTYSTCDGALHRLVGDCNIEGLETQADHPELFR
ncbi:MAG: hypothetical protein O2960_03410 [Verrucomicrobia bacterium]|nr:hypothetical protein [Verrucomicrobiota bacterium]